MHYGTVRWFNKKTGAGLIRTDDGEGVIFLNSDIQDSDPSSIDKGSRVTLDVQKSRSGVLAAINVRSTELSHGTTDHFTYNSLASQHDLDARFVVEMNEKKQGHF